MPYTFKIRQIARKSKACIPPDYHAFHKFWLKLDESRGSSGFLKILTSEILQSAPNAQTELRWPDSKNMRYIWTFLELRVPNFHPFRSTANTFQDIAHFMIFPLNSILKFQSATYFLKLGWLPKRLYSTMVVNGLMKIDWRWVKPVGGVAFWNFQTHIVLC